MIPYPLQWPSGVPRAKSRNNSLFKTTLHKAMENVKDSLRLFGSDTGRPVTNVVISSNVTLGQDKPADPGVAIWFTWQDKQRCVAVDRYPTTMENLQAIHHVLEARRTEARHGGLVIAEQAFAGFTALPGPAKKTWREVLGLGPNATASDVQAAYLKMIQVNHPDRGGTTERAAEINAARDEALKELGA